MKKIIFVLGLLTCIISYSEEKSTVTEVVSSVVSGAVSTGKNIKDRIELKKMLKFAKKRRYNIYSWFFSISKINKRFIRNCRVS